MSRGPLMDAAYLHLWFVMLRTIPCELLPVYTTPTSYTPTKTTRPNRTSNCSSTSAGTNLLSYSQRDYPRPLESMRGVTAGTAFKRWNVGTQPKRH
ncbi:hypothetical protein AB1N83_001027 [Pleurotus pulmonarius]